MGEPPADATDPPGSRRVVTGSSGGAVAALARLILVLAVSMLVAGCRDPDPDEARVCRLAIAGLLGPGEAPVVTRQGLVPDHASAPDVRIDYLAGSPRRPGFVQCRFAPAGLSRGRPDLVALATRDGVLSEPRLFFLKRFWLDTPEAGAADPQPIAPFGPVPTVSPGFAYGLQQLLNALPSVAIYGLLAAAYSLVYGLAGRVNLAFGEMAAIGGAGALAGAALLGRDATLPLIGAALAAALWAASLHGYAIARLVFVPLRRSTGQQGLVATVGLALVLNEYLRLAQGPAPAWISPLRTTPRAVARSGTFFVTATPVGLAVAAVGFACAAGVLVLLRRSQFGRNWRAMADDARAASLMGVDAVRVFSQTFVLAAALAGVSGAIVVLVYGSFGTTLGTSLGLKALLAAVLGGIGSVPGAFLGGLVLGCVEAGWSAFYSIDYRDLVVFILLAVAIVARPGGILGYADLAPRRV